MKMLLKDKIVYISINWQKLKKINIGGKKENNLFFKVKIININFYVQNLDKNKKKLNNV